MRYFRRKQYDSDLLVRYQLHLDPGALFMGADTPLGPFLVGFGYTQPSERRVFLSFGRSFF